MGRAGQASESVNPLAYGVPTQPISLCYREAGVDEPTTPEASPIHMRMGVRMFPAPLTQMLLPAESRLQIG